MEEKKKSTGMLGGGVGSGLGSLLGMAGTAMMLKNPKVARDIAQASAKARVHPMGMQGALMGMGQLTGGNLGGALGGGIESDSHMGGFMGGGMGATLGGGLGSVGAVELAKRLISDKDPKKLFAKLMLAQLAGGTAGAIGGGTIGSHLGSKSLDT